MTTSLCKHEEKAETLEEEMIHMHHTFKNVVDECQKTTNMMTMNLSTDVDECLRAMEDSLSSVVIQFKDQEDTINVLKWVVASGHSSLVPMRINIKEP